MKFWCSFLDRIEFVGPENFGEKNDAASGSVIESNHDDVSMKTFRQGWVVSLSRGTVQQSWASSYQMPTDREFPNFNLPHFGLHTFFTHVPYCHSFLLGFTIKHFLVSNGEKTSPVVTTHWLWLRLPHKAFGVSFHPCFGPNLVFRWHDLAKVQARGRHAKTTNSVRQQDWAILCRRSAAFQKKNLSQHNKKAVWLINSKPSMSERDVIRRIKDSMSILADGLAFSLGWF